MSDYWQIRERDAIYNQQLGLAEKQLAKEYIRCANKTKLDIVNLYYEIMDSIEDETILISDFYKYERYYTLLNNLNKNLLLLGLKEIEINDAKLTNMYKKSFELTGKEIGFNTIVNDTMVKLAINRIWVPDGKAWSLRVWGNTQLLAERVLKGMIDCVARGVNKDELVKQCMRDFNVGFNNADRLIRTELSHIQNLAAYDKYIEAGIDYYEFYTAEDERTCDECGQIHGLIFRMNEAQEGINFPPIHPNCRCTILAVMKEEENV